MDCMMNMHGICTYGTIAAIALSAWGLIEGGGVMRKREGDRLRGTL